MKVSQRLYEKALPIWESYFTHPFIQGMADGTLAKDKFQFYMIQDHKYLMEYAKVFALGVIKSRDEKDMRLFAAFIADTLNTENAVHQFFLKELGITQEDIERTPMCLNNDSYTNYMIAVAMKEGLDAQLTAWDESAGFFFWSYKLIGDYMETIPGALEQPFYGRWSSTYVSDAFRGGNQTVIDLLDRLTEGYTEEQIQNLEHILINCSKYEYQFWDMAWTKGEMDYRL